MERNFCKEKDLNDVVLSVIDNGVTADMDKTHKIGGSPSREGFDFGIKSQDNIKVQEQGNLTRNAPMSPEITPRISPFSTPQRTPRVPNELMRRRPSVMRSTTLSKSKSRLVEPPSPSDDALDDETQFVGSKTPLRNTPKRSPRVGVSTPVIPKSPFTVPAGNDVDDDEDVYKFISLQGKEQHRNYVFVLLEWIVFVGLMSLLATSLAIPHLRHTSFWSLGMWKWCVLVVVIFCGRLVTGWFITILVYLAEQKLLFKKKALYFVYGLKNSVRVFLWLSFVLLAWLLLVIHGNNRSRKIQKDLHHVTMTIAGCLVGAGIWLAKTILIKTLALSFHVKRFFDRMQESIFHQYVLQKLSGPPLKDTTQNFARAKSDGQLSVERVKKGEGVEEVINIEKLHKISQDKVSAWTMKGLIDIIRRTKLSTISNTFDYDEEDEMVEQNEDITSEWEAKVAAIKIFNNVAKPGYKYIEEEDLLRFFRMDEVDQVFPLFEGAIETGNIKKSALKKWVVNSYLERKSLALSLNDTKTAVDDLNKIVSAVVLIIIIIVWNLMMGFLNTKLLVFVTSQLLLTVFMFGNTVKTVFEAIIFVFVMHPFDVGDRCVIDGVQMVVEEMNILTTIFLRYDNELISYPNSDLATKPISNFYRSPEMSDSVEFAIGFSTTADTIAALKTKINLYIESKPQNWRPSHSVQLLDIVDMNNIKMALYVTHIINFQNIGEKGSRKSDLVMELKKIFEELGIKYHLLPLEVHVKSLETPPSASVARL